MLNICPNYMTVVQSIMLGGQKIEAFFFSRPMGFYYVQQYVMSNTIITVVRTRLSYLMNNKMDGYTFLAIRAKGCSVTFPCNGIQFVDEYPVRNRYLPSRTHARSVDIVRRYTHIRACFRGAEKIFERETNRIKETSKREKERERCLCLIW